MREILFRGRHVHAFSCNKSLDGTWVYGYLVDENYINDKRDLGDGEYLGEMLIDPKTVGQFTGLLDKNGKKIFEGDIVRHYNKTGVGDPYSYYLGTVAWNNERLRYENKAATETYTIGTGSAYEVIGNIHENPELLEVTP